MITKTLKGTIIRTAKGEQVYFCKPEKAVKEFRKTDALSGIEVEQFEKTYAMCEATFVEFADEVTKENESEDNK